MAFIFIGIQFIIVLFALEFPLNINKITGSFCEFRINHLHTGIDISTNHRLNLPVVAPENGYISYIKQDFLGYGKALFLNTDKYIYVFAHLNKFSEKIHSFLDTTKYRQFLYLDDNTIKIKKGDTIAFTGRSATKYPHLHFEIRSLKNHPLNPLLFFNIEDKEFPVFKGIVIEPADDSSIVEGRHEIMFFKTKKVSKSYYNGTVNIKGAFKIYPLIIDKKNTPNARLFVYKLQIYSNKSLIFSFQNDSTSFLLSKYSPKLYKGYFNLKDREYIFNPHSDLSYWNINKKCKILYSNIDTLLIIIAEDIKGNRSIFTLKINNSRKTNISIGDYRKISFVNNKLCIVNSNYKNIPKHIPGFKLYMNNNYLYYIYDTKNNILAPFKINNFNIEQSFIYIDNKKPFELNNVKISTSEPIQVLFKQKNINLNGFINKTPLFEFSLNNNFYNSIKYVIQNYKGYSFYLFKNNKYRFVKKLNYIDTINSHYIGSFIIGKDIKKPIYYFISKQKKYKYTEYIYLLKDELSGIDWNFVSDSNTLYNIPDPPMSRITIRGNKKDTFIIKDKEGNINTIILP